MPAVYPDDVPEISLHPVRGGLDADEVRGIVEKVSAQAKILTGNEMVFELVELTRQLLEQAARRHNTSVYDERQQNIVKKVCLNCVNTTNVL